MIGAPLSPRLRLTGLAAAAALVALAGCGKDAPPAKVRVATAFTPLQEIVTTIGGGRVASTDLTPLGGQPHGLQLSPAAQTALKRAKLVVYLSGAFQPAVDEAVAKLPAATTKLDLASDATLSAAKRVPGMRGFVEGAGADPAAADPHVWLDPERFAQMAQQTQAALAAADPAHRAEFQARGGKYLATITQLAADYKAGLTGCEREVVVSTHPAWGYLAERHGLRQVVAPGITPGAAADPRSLAALAKFAERNDVETLFTTVAFPAKQAKAIKAATGLTVQPLNPVEGLTQDERDQGATYVSVMRENLSRLTASLKCDGAAAVGTTPTTPTDARAIAMREHLSLAEARRVALAAQGFADKPLGRAVDARALRSRVIDRVGLLQIDSVNVLQRAHYLPAFSRLGPYDVDQLDKLAGYAPRRMFEYWGHEASLLPVELWPLMQWRMARVHDDAWGGMRRVAKERPGLVAAVLADITDRGPLRVADLSHHDEPRGPKGPWWDWSDVKRAVEYLFWSGEITSARRVRFERRYDIPSRVIPAAVRAIPTPSTEDAQRELIRIASRAMGVATEPDLRDYFRLSSAESKARVAELVEAGELLPVAVEGWTAPAYLAPGTRIPRSVDARAIVGPFDSLIWERPRVERLFGLRYRIEIYVPKPKRVYGYYVLPFLLGDQLVGRVDLKADRAAGALLVQAAHAEPGAPPETAEALMTELRAMAAWLGLSDVVVVGPGDLAPALAAVS